MDNQLTENEIRRLFPNASAAVIRRSCAVGAVGAPVGKQDSPNALEPSPPAQPKRNRRLEYLVTIIVCRPRVLDDDNSESGGTKALRDAIAASLGINDGSKRIKFEYGQCHSFGATGCLVRIQHFPIGRDQ